MGFGRSAWDDDDPAVAAMLGHVHVGGVGSRIGREVTRGDQAGLAQHVKVTDQGVRSLEHSDFAGRLDGCVKSGITILKTALDFLMRNGIEIFSPAWSVSR